MSAPGGKNRVSLLDLVAALSALSLAAALVFPVVAKQKERARQETCYGNLRQLTQAMLLYAQDNDGYPAPAAIDYGRVVKGKTWFGTVAYWPELLYPYVGSADPFWCPAAPFERPPWGEGMEWKSYAVNVHIAGRIKDGARPRPLSDIAHPGEVGLFVDSSGVCLLSYEDLASEPSREPYLFPGFYTAGYTVGSRAAFPAHSGGVVMAYLDGHASWMPFQAFVGDPDAAMRLWGEPYSL